MPLPNDFLATIAAGVKALAGEETRLRKLSCNGDPRVLLDLRDVVGLHSRTRRARIGRAARCGASFAPQDVGVLNRTRGAQRGFAIPGSGRFRVQQTGRLWTGTRSMVLICSMSVSDNKADAPDIAILPLVLAGV